MDHFDILQLELLGEKQILGLLQLRQPFLKEACSLLGVPAITWEMEEHNQIRSISRLKAHLQTE